MGLVGLSALVPSLLLVSNSLGATHRQPILVAFAATAMLLLVLWRLVGAAMRLHHQIIVGLPRTLSLDVVAEGVETVRERQTATEIGCAYGQGYLYSRPMPEADALRWLAAEPSREVREPAMV